MNKIIDFLQSQSENEHISENSVDKDKLLKSFKDIKSTVVSSEVKEQNIFRLKSRPKIKKNQIWLCRQQYFDAFGNEIIGHSPYLVFVVSDVDKFGNENFIRIQPISPFTEFAAGDELLIKDDSVVGFDFIIETWNEQPILTNLLDEFVGNLNMKDLKIDKTKPSLSNTQKEFRKAEIRNTAYLRQSINSLLEYEENKEEKVVFLNFNNTVIEPINSDIGKVINMVAEPYEEFLQAAKKGKLKDRPTYLFDKIIKGVAIKWKIIKDKNEFILSIIQPNNIQLKDQKGVLIKPTGKSFYDNLKSGIYFAIINGIKEEIRIILN